MRPLVVREKMLSPRTLGKPPTVSLRQNPGKPRAAATSFIPYVPTAEELDRKMINKRFKRPYARKCYYWKPNWIPTERMQLHFARLSQLFVNHIAETESRSSCVPTSSASQNRGDKLLEGESSLMAAFTHTFVVEDRAAGQALTISFVAQKIRANSQTIPNKSAAAVSNFSSPANAAKTSASVSAPAAKVFEENPSYAISIFVQESVFNSASPATSKNHPEISGSTHSSPHTPSVKILSSADPQTTNVVDLPVVAMMEIAKEIFAAKPKITASVIQTISAPVQEFVPEVSPIVSQIAPKVSPVQSSSPINKLATVSAEEIQAPANISNTITTIIGVSFVAEDLEIPSMQFVPAQIVSSTVSTQPLFATVLLSPELISEPLPQSEIAIPPTTISNSKTQHTAINSNTSFSNDLQFVSIPTIQLTPATNQVTTQSASVSFSEFSSTAPLVEEFVPSSVPSAIASNSTLETPQVASPTNSASKKSGGSMTYFFGQKSSWGMPLMHDPAAPDPNK